MATFIPTAKELNEILQEKGSLLGETGFLTDDDRQKLIDGGFLPPTPAFIPTEKEAEQIAKQEVEQTGPDWTAPFHMPEFTDDEYSKKRDKYVAENGFTLTVPALSDIFHFGKMKPMTKQEKWAFRKKKWDMFTEERLDELLKDKNRRLDRIESMMGSPTPELFSKIGSIVTAIDDAQDAISTLAAIARIVRKIAPKAAAKFITGPVGWLMLASDILNIMTTMGQSITMPFLNKRTKDGITVSSMRNKKHKYKYVDPNKRWIPTLADLIQAAQTSDQIFGIGVSLGPVTGFLQDAWWAGIRSKQGQTVKLKMSPHSVPEWIKTSYNALFSSPAALALPGDDVSIPTLEFLQSQAMANEAVQAYQKRWNAFDQVINLENAEIRAPIPEHPLTLNAIDEANLKPEEIVGWPIIDKLWATPAEINETYAKEIEKHVNDYVQANRQNDAGMLASSLVAETAPYQMSNIQSEDSVMSEYSTASRAASSMLQENYYPDPNNPVEAQERFAAFLEYQNQQGNAIPMKALKGWANHYGFNLIRKDQPV